MGERGLTGSQHEGFHSDSTVSHLWDLGKIRVSLRLCFIPEKLKGLVYLISENPGKVSRSCQHIIIIIFSSYHNTVFHVGCLASGFQP